MVAGPVKFRTTRCIDTCKGARMSLFTSATASLYTIWDLRENSIYMEARHLSCSSCSGGATTGLMNPMVTFSCGDAAKTLIQYISEKQRTRADCPLRSHIRGPAFMLCRITVPYRLLTLGIRKLRLKLFPELWKVEGIRKLRLKLLPSFGGQNRSFGIPTGDFSQNRSFLGPRKNRFWQKRGSGIQTLAPSKSQVLTIEYIPCIA